MEAEVGASGSRVVTGDDLGGEEEDLSASIVLGEALRGEVAASFIMDEDGAARLDAFPGLSRSDVVAPRKGV